MWVACGGGAHQRLSLPTPSFLPSLFKPSATTPMAGLLLRHRRSDLRPSPPTRPRHPRSPWHTSPSRPFWRDEGRDIGSMWPLQCQAWRAVGPAATGKEGGASGKASGPSSAEPRGEREAESRAARPHGHSSGGRSWRLEISGGAAEAREARARPHGAEAGTATVRLHGTEAGAVTARPRGHFGVVPGERRRDGERRGKTGRERRDRERR
ncbi:hypothetical protein PVAP13_3KG572032 [Panicum virgatum]|uniref:Uncharacterized protein n=1 Tax=Panicum virgatum TaxID=38727 RepID=A0A8T0VEA2_PANVG|nr:hypothetical protein PVAP13_3KG572032 [Panicum virgatum]